MSPGDLVGLILSYVYAFGVLTLIEGVGRRFSWRQQFTRKVIHIAAGMWIWGILLLFDHWYLGIIPFATFIGLNYIFYRRQTFRAMDASDSSPGTVYFAISITVLFTVCWRTGGSRDLVPIAAAAVMAMTWGDAMASIIGIRWGQQRFRVFGHQRSLEGSAAMFATSFVAILLTLLVLPGSSLSPSSRPIAIPIAILMSLVGTMISTLAEATSPAGTDNLSVPLLCAISLYTVQTAAGSASL